VNLKEAAFAADVFGVFVARASKYFSCFFSLNNNNNKKLVFDVFD
jgi:hypothetical protein